MSSKLKIENRKSKIKIVNYGMGNLRSVQKAFESVGHTAGTTSDPNELGEADKIVLPGVGAFRDAISKLRSSGLDRPILDHIKAGKPFLGICLGLQLLFDKSYEDGEHEGLGVVPGTVVRFTPQSGLKIPHMGWNQLKVCRPSPIFDGLPESPEVYFVHSYYVAPVDSDWTAAETDYPGPFTSAIWADNVFATQFHPEKSQQIGLRMLQNFTEYH